MFKKSKLFTVCGEYTPGTYRKIKDRKIINNGLMYFFVSRALISVIRGLIFQHGSLLKGFIQSRKRFLSCKPITSVKADKEMSPDKSTAMSGVKNQKSFNEFYHFGYLN